MRHIVFDNQQKIIRPQLEEFARIQGCDVLSVLVRDDEHITECWCIGSE